MAEQVSRRNSEFRVSAKFGREKRSRARAMCGRFRHFASFTSCIQRPNQSSRAAELCGRLVVSLARGLPPSQPMQCMCLHTCNNGRSEINSIPVLHVVASTHSFTSFAGSSCCSQAQTTLFSSLAAPIGTSPAHTTSQLPWTDSDERERYYVVTDEPRTYKGQKERERET